MRQILLVFFTILSTAPAYTPRTIPNPGSSYQDLPKFIYAHIGMSGNLFVLISHDMNQFIDPFKSFKNQNKEEELCTD